MRISYLPSVDQHRASSRYRQIIPGQELEKQGHTVYYVEAKRNSEWVIVNKAVSDEYQKSAWMGYNKVCFDMCDNHFITQYRQNHISMCMRADMITCSTEAMKDEIYNHTQRVAEVIPDPYELEIIEPREVEQIETLFWHGGNQNVTALENITSAPFEVVEIQHSEGSLVHSVINIDSNRYHFLAVGADKYNFSLPYSNENTINGMSYSDICIIPVDNDDWGKCKSPNRLMNAVARGLFVVANEMPSYEPFSEWMYLGDIAEGLEWAKQNMSELKGRVKSAQDYIIKNHSPHVIGEKWARTLGLTSDVETGIGMDSLM